MLNKPVAAPDFILAKDGSLVATANLARLARTGARLEWQLTDGQRLAESYGDAAAAGGALRGYASLLLAADAEPEPAGEDSSPRLTGIFPNYWPANAPNAAVNPAGVLITALGANFPGSAYALFLVNGTDADSGIAMLSLMIGDSQLYNSYGGSSFPEGTYDVVLYNAADEELDRLAAAFQVGPAAGYAKSPNPDLWAAVAAPTTELPADETLPGWFHGSTDSGTTYDTLYAWDVDTAQWRGIIVA